MRANHGYRVPWLPLRTDRERYDGTGITGEVVFATWLERRGPWITFLYHITCKKESHTALLWHKTYFDLLESGLLKSQLRRMDRMKSCVILATVFHPLFDDRSYVLETYLRSQQSPPLASAKLC